ncbi:DUF2637 domain-containing protein, partial [Streptomyces mirabilis]|uniref:DUF2637 domain-containing protein n=1 Tax=Streptomyces mirabilis TaxID=68239 RepID=UPI00332FBFC6
MVPSCVVCGWERARRQGGALEAGTVGERHRLTRVQRSLVGVVGGGALVIAGIGFAGSYAAVRELALKKGFGNFAY